MKTNLRHVTMLFCLKPELKAALDAASIASGKSENKIIRTALRRYLKKLQSSTEPEIDSAHLEEIVAKAIVHTGNWESCQRELARNGLKFIARGGGLAIASTKTEDVLCKASALGLGYSSLIKKFGAGFPGHPHEWLTDRVLKSGPEQG